METIRGKHTSFIDSSALFEYLDGYEAVHVDIGTGDGRFVQHIAQTRPNYRFVIGIDACRENLHEVSRRVSANTLFVIANALALPQELYGIATQITINFPWGSLLSGLTTNDPALMAGLVALCRPNAGLEVRLNAGALAEIGWSLDEGSSRIRDVLAENGFQMRLAVALTAADLKSCPTTWARRLAFGRDPRAVYLQGANRVNLTAEMPLITRMSVPAR